VILIADKIEEAFARTTKLLFGRPLSGPGRYAKWLSLRYPPAKAVPSALGGGTAYFPEYGFFKAVPMKNMVPYSQQAQVSQKNIGKITGAETIASISARLPSFTYFVPGFMEGTNIDVRNSSGCIDCLNLQNCYDSFTAKNSAYVHSIMDADSIFGMFRVRGASFSIHGYNCIGIQRCFELDGAKNCSDCYFCHNAENLSDCMFCFNAKNLRCAIGNLELGREKYLEARKRLVDQLTERLEKHSRLDFDIYDCLCSGR
jgi:hypothetical protein